MLWACGGGSQWLPLGVVCDDWSVCVEILTKQWLGYWDGEGRERVSGVVWLWDCGSC